MEEKIVIGIVVVITIATHFWIFRWVKFKMDEGTILKFLRESESQESIGSQEISLNINIPVGRVTTVCRKSKAIKSNFQDIESWRLF